MIHCPLSTLMLAGVREVLVTTTPHEANQFHRLLGDGSTLGIEISYAVQPSPDGLAQAFHIGAYHVGTEPVALVLGDNIFYSAGLGTRLRRFSDLDGAAVFGYRVSDPSAYGVVDFDRNPVSPYGIGKVALENYLSYFALEHGLQSVSLRISNPCGPGQRSDRAQGLIPIALRAARDDCAVTQLGDGSMTRGYVFCPT